MSQNGQPLLSLLSLSIAAANAAPIPAESAARSQGPTTNTTKHRRRSSAGRSRRRLSEARDAATRPFPTSLQTASASFAALSLSSPTMASRRSLSGVQPIQVPRTPTKGTSEPEPASFDDALSVPPQSRTPHSIHVTKTGGRKRGTLFTCESCSKVYRHPSCLIKHRWEHTPQWREASKFVLSKHQQVQLLEAAAILSHLSPSSASLPEDRSLWPSFLSGGLVPLPASMSNNDVEPVSPPTTASTISPTSAPTSNGHAPFPSSSSVPASTVLDAYRAGSAEPRLRDDVIGGPGVGITHVRSGMLRVPTASVSLTNGKRLPMPMAAATVTTEDDALNLLALREASVTSGSYESPPHSHSRSYSYTHVHPRAHAHTHAHSHSLSIPHVSKERTRRRSNAYEYEFGSDDRSGSSGYAYAADSNGGWSLPRSSVRSKSGSSGSRSRSPSPSESRSDEEALSSRGANVEVDPGLEWDPDGDGDGDVVGRRARVRQGVYGPRVRAWKAEDEEGGATNPNPAEDAGKGRRVGKGKGTGQTWDGMEMEMEMD